MKLILTLCLLFANSVYAEDWKIDQKTRDDCAKDGGCVLMIPDGTLIPAKVLNEMVIELQRRAYEMGLTEGGKLCKRKDV